MGPFAESCPEKVSTASLAEKRKLLPFSALRVVAVRELLLSISSAVPEWRVNEVNSALPPFSCNLAEPVRLPSV
jgi:hypothetical protein